MSCWTRGVIFLSLRSAFESELDGDGDEDEPEVEVIGKGQERV
jgi:hypothetical protein